METFSALLAICAEMPVVRSFDVFFDLCDWINGWVNNGEAGDLRCHRANYDVTVSFNRRHRKASIDIKYIKM